MATETNPADATCERKISRLDHAIAAAIAVSLGLLYAFPAASLGFWEPWETVVATIAWQVATDPLQSVFMPMHEGVIVGRPWLETGMLALGYKLGGGSEFGFRLPFLALNLFTAVFTFYVIRALFGRWRALAASILFGVAPGILLASVNVAGAAHYIGPITLAMVSAAALFAAPERFTRSLLPLLGLWLALCFWGLGVPGLAAPLGVIALYAVGSRHAGSRGTFRTLPVFVGGGVALLSVALPLLWTLHVGASELGELVAAVDGDGLNLDATFSAQMAAGWVLTREVVAMFIAIGLPVGVLIAATPGSRADALLNPTFGSFSLVILLVGVAIPVSAVFTAVGQNPELGLNNAMGFMLTSTLLTERVLPEHVTFDIFIRLVGFSAYPTVALAPFGFAYLLRTSTDGSATDDASEGARSFKMFVLIWIAVCFVVFGLAATLARSYVFALVYPITLGVALSLTDRAYLKALFSNRLAFHVIGAATLFLLVVLSKDVRGTYNLELGRPGPHVIFESLLTDGKVAFPDIYSLAWVSLFIVAWALTILVFFGRPIHYLRVITRSVDQVRPKERTSLIKRAFGKAIDLALRVVRPVLQLATRLVDLAVGPILRRFAPGSIALTVFTCLVAVWGYKLANFDIPTMTNHFSMKGLVDTYEVSSDPDDVLIRLGADTMLNSYYLRDRDVQEINNVSELGTLFCEAEGRVFAIMAASYLAEAYYTVRTTSAESDECEEQDLYVIDARSTRFILASNRLRSDRGDTQQSIIAENVFTEETIPSDAVRLDEPYLVDNRIELIAYRVPESTSGDFDLETFWRVNSRPRAGYQSFIHVDYSGNRINGDHDLVEGAFPMNYWVPGEIVRDRFTLEVSRTDPRGEYTIFYGFFRGDNRLTVNRPSTTENRIPLGTILVTR